MSKTPKKAKVEPQEEIVPVEEVLPETTEAQKQANKMNLILTYAKIFKCGATWVESLINTVINMVKDGKL